jgi:DNA mismatch repair protein MutS
MNSLALPIEDTFEICITTTNGLSRFLNSYFLISIHIQKLKNVSNDTVSNYPVDCKLVEDIPAFTHKIKKGWWDVKVGRILLAKEGLNDLLN